MYGPVKAFHHSIYNSDTAECLGYVLLSSVFQRSHENAEINATTKWHLIFQNKSKTLPGQKQTGKEKKNLKLVCKMSKL